MTLIENSDNLTSEDAVIPTAGTAPAIFTEGRALVGLQMPASWTAAKIGFEVSIDGATFCTVKDNGGAVVQATVAASDYCAAPTATTPVYGPWIKIKSVDASNAAVVQGAARTVKLLFRRLSGGR